MSTFLRLIFFQSSRLFSCFCHSLTCSSLLASRSLSFPFSPSTGSSIFGCRFVAYTIGNKMWPILISSCSIKSAEIVVPTRSARNSRRVEGGEGRRLEAGGGCRAMTCLSPQFRWSTFPKRPYFTASISFWLTNPIIFSKEYLAPTYT